MQLRLSFSEKDSLTEAIILSKRHYSPRMEQERSQHQALSYEHDEATFEQVFKDNFKALHAYAYTFVQDSSVAEDMVQAVFIRLWEKSRTLEIHSSLNAYLYRAVYHECLNYLKHQKVRAAHETHVKHSGGRHSGDASQTLQLKELEQRVAGALATLPEGCRAIFQMSRFESLKYQQIADKLGISVKTVENQMGKALKILRTKLKDYLTLLLLIATILHELSYIIIFHG